MIDILGLVSIGIAAFAATNIDDIFVLMMFFSSFAFPVRQVILGQYIGIGLLIAISALGSLIALVVPTYIIGLLGIIPIAIGIKNLIEIRKNDKSPSSQVVEDKKNKSYLSIIAVVAVTFSNGGDNIGIYVPLFSKYNTVSQITALAAIFFAMTAFCCIATYFVNHPLVASRIRHTGNIICLLS
jgi:cadmium resistance protein CadD (predicted permease)